MRWSAKLQLFKLMAINLFLDAIVKITLEEDQVNKIEARYRTKELFHQ
mgnify:CR=1 FL=1